MGRLIIFISIFTSIYLAVHYYLYHSFFKYTNLSARKKYFIRLFVLLSGLSYLAGRMLSANGMPAYFLLLYGSLWMGFVSVALTIFILKDLTSLFLKKYAKQINAAAGITAIAVCFYALVNVLIEPKINYIEIETDKIEIGVVKKLVQISDLHLDALTSKSRLKSIVNRVNLLNPDTVVITGDLVDADICGYKKYCELLSKFRAEKGVFAVTGNHEYYVGVDIFMDVARESGITALRNTVVELDTNIRIAGVDDYAGSSRKPDIANLTKTLDGASNDKYTILLAHRPLFFKEASQMGVDLQLSGHTHSGQIPPFDFFVWLLYDYPYGLHKYGSSYIYTTSGTGTWGPPMRLLSRSEIVFITIKGAGKQKKSS